MDKIDVLLSPSELFLVTKICTALTTLSNEASSQAIKEKIKRQELLTSIMATRINNNNKLQEFTNTEENKENKEMEKEPNKTRSSEEENGEILMLVIELIVMTLGKTHQSEENDAKEKILDLLLWTIKASLNQQQSVLSLLSSSSSLLPLIFLSSSSLLPLPSLLPPSLSSPSLSLFSLFSLPLFVLPLSSLSLSLLPPSSPSLFSLSPL
jgi:uncharacterized membrane protein YbjE (DUF340 family)